MPTPTKGPRLGGSPSHQRLILANLATSLFEHGQITTTETRARRLRPYAEHLITKAKHDSLANRRQVVRAIRDKSILHVLFTEIGPRFASRPGGYTRITKLGPRKGDNAPMAVIELVEERDFATSSEPAAQQRAKPAESEPAAEETAAEETLAEETLAEETLAEETAAEETPAEETPAEETAAEETAAPTTDEDTAASEDEDSDTKNS